MAEEIRKRTRTIAANGFELPEQVRRDAVHVIYKKALSAIRRGDTPTEMEAIAARWTDDTIIG